jgi:hypothetical protein
MEKPKFRSRSRQPSPDFPVKIQVEPDEKIEKMAANPNILPHSDPDFEAQYYLGDAYSGIARELWEISTWASLQCFYFAKSLYTDGILEMRGHI